MLLEAANLPAPMEQDVIEDTHTPVAQKPKADPGKGGTPSDSPTEGSASGDVQKYDPGEARDDKGQWTSGGGSAAVDHEVETLHGLREQSDAQSRDASLTAGERRAAGARANRIGRAERSLSRGNAALRAGRIDSARQHWADAWQTSGRFGAEHETARAAFGATRRGTDAMGSAVRRHQGMAKGDDGLDMTRMLARVAGADAFTSDALDDGLHHHFRSTTPEASAERVRAYYATLGIETEVSNEKGLWSVEVVMDGQEHMIHFLPASGKSPTEGNATVGASS